MISYGDGTFSYAAIPLDGGRADGMTLLDATGLAVLSIDFGGYGQGVCKIEVVGCDVSTCRLRMCQTADSNSPFWRYLLVGDTGWVMSPLGANATTVKAGHVYGWAWSGGHDVPADMPVVTINEVIARSGFDPDANPPRPAVWSTGPLSSGDTVPLPRDAYLGAGVILVVLGAGGMAVVRRAAGRARTPAS